MTNKVVTPLFFFLLLLLLIHVVVLGSVQWTNNSKGGRIGAAVVGITLTVLVYLQEAMYTRWIIEGKVGGTGLVSVILFGVLSTVYVQATVFFIMGTFGEAFFPLGPVDQAYDVFYRTFFPMAAGVFMTAGNASSTPQGIPGNLWWVCTSFVGGIHLLFIMGLGMARLVETWIERKNVKSLRTPINPLEFGGAGMRRAIGINQIRKRTKVTSGAQLQTVHLL